MNKALIISLFYILGGVLGFIFQLILVRTFGASEETDIYFILNSFPSIITGIAPTIFVSVFIPKLASLEERQLGSSIRGLLIYVTYTAVIIAILGGVITSIYLNKLYEFTSDSSYTIALTINILFWLAACIAIINGFLSCVNNFFKFFIVVAATPLVTYILNILCLVFLSPWVGILCLGVSSILAVVLQFIIYAAQMRCIPILKKYTTDYSICFPLGTIASSVLFTGISLLPFTTFSNISYQWAGLLAIGATSYLGYSHSFSGFLSTAVSMGLSTVTFPDLAKSMKENNDDQKRNAILVFERSVIVVMVIGAFITVAFVAYNEQILKFLFQNESFNDSNVIDFSRVLPFYLCGGVIIGGLNIVRNFYYSVGLEKTLSYICLGAVILFILSFLIFRSHVNYIVVAIIENGILLSLLLVLSFFLHNEYQIFSMKNLQVIFRDICVFVILSLLLKTVLGYLEIPFLLTFFVFGVAYVIITDLILAKIFKVQEVVAINNRIITLLK